MSSANSSKSFDLRCLVREQMIAYVKENYPFALPTLRIEMKDMGRKSAEPVQEQSLGEAKG
jgi:uncharacterized protein YneF (UPF0154 family)